MTISKKAFEALKTNGVADDIIKEIEEQNESLKTFEGGDRLYDKLTKQLGANTVEELLSAKATLDGLGGAEKVKEIETKLATTEADKTALKAKYDSIEIENQKIKADSETITKEFERAKIKSTVLPTLIERFGDFASDVWELSGNKIVSENNAIFFSSADGAKLPFESKGIEAFAEANKRFAKAPSGSGQGGNAPTAPSNGNPPKRSLSFI